MPVSPEYIGATTSLPSQCFVPLATNSSKLLPTLGIFGALRDGKISGRLVENPGLASQVLATESDLEVKARYLEYLRSVTSSNEEAIRLVRRSIASTDQCYEAGIAPLAGELRRLQAMHPNQRVNTGTRVEEAGALVREGYKVLRDARALQQINRALYENIISELRRGRSVESVRQAASGGPSWNLHKHPSVVVEGEARTVSSLEPTKSLEADRTAVNSARLEQNATSPRESRQNSPGIAKAIPKSTTPDLSDPLDRDWAKNMRHGRNLGLL